MTNELVADCANCVGLCCVALAFARSADFAFSKDAGDECRNLTAEYRCQIHSTLRADGFKGCTVFDCHGAGQKVTQTNFAGASWRESPVVSEGMFSVFRVVRQLHEMLWYLAVARRFAGDGDERSVVESTYAAVAAHSVLAGDRILALDLDEVRDRVNAVLRGVSDGVRMSARGERATSLPRRLAPGASLIGANLAAQDLRGADLRGALLIAANLDGADLRACDLLAADIRDTQLSNADLSTTLYVTQMQLNAARGNRATLLPPGTVRPEHWV